MLLVFEGIDGSGKSTQVKLFPADYKLAFPRYDHLLGKLIRLIYTWRWLSQASPYLIAFLFAFDRFLAKPLIRRHLRKGETVALDRYTYSSMAHQGAKLSGEKQEKLINWIDWLENKFFRLPQADKVIYLKLPPQQTQKLMQDRHKDLAEVDFAYQQRTAQVYLALAKKYRFIVIDCLDKKNRLLSKNDVSQKIKRAVSSSRS